MANSYQTGQIDLFSFLGDISILPYDGTLIPQEDMPKAAEESGDVTAYLSVEEKILSLVRQRKTKKLSSSGLYAIFQKKKIVEKACDYIWGKVEDYVRDFLIDGVKASGTGASFEIPDELDKLIGNSRAASFARSLEFTTHGSAENSHFQLDNYEKKVPVNYQLVLNGTYRDHPAYYSLNRLKKGQRTRNRIYRYRSLGNSFSWVCDAATVFARAVIFNEVKLHVDADETLQEEIRERLRSNLDMYTSNGSLIIADSEFCRKLAGVAQVEFLTAKVKKVGSRERDEGKMKIFSEDTLLSISHGDTVLYCQLLGLDIDWANYAVRSFYDTVLVNLYSDILKQDIYIEEMISYSRNQASDYARSFETKKNIPEKMIKAMEESGFNNYFGYVEFDSECDTEKLKKLYKEWDALAKTYFGGRSFKDVSIRFRKLGNHHAIGLYYSVMRCICVDIRSPGSMVHEFMHMIDDGTLSGISHDYLSLKQDFKGILDFYCYLIDKCDEIPSKGKYKKDYYKTPTEVFARCGEMYVHRYLGVNNSLVGNCTGFAYPENETLNKKIVAYYDTLFSTVFGYERKEATADERNRSENSGIYTKVSSC